jgi:hypothetical protein
MNLIRVMTVSNRKRNMFKNNTNDSNLNLVRSGQVLAPRQLSILGNAANFEAFQTAKRRAYLYIPEVAAVLYFVFVSLEEIGGLTPPTEIKILLGFYQQTQAKRKDLEPEDALLAVVDLSCLLARPFFPTTRRFNPIPYHIKIDLLGLRVRKVDKDDGKEQWIIRGSRP